MFRHQEQDRILTFSFCESPASSPSRLALFDWRAATALLICASWQYFHLPMSPRLGTSACATADGGTQRWISVGLQACFSSIINPTESSQNSKSFHHLHIVLIYSIDKLYIGFSHIFHKLFLCFLALLDWFWIFQPRHSNVTLGTWCSSNSQDLYYHWPRVAKLFSVRAITQQQHIM